MKIYEIRKVSTLAKTFYIKANSEDEALMYTKKEELDAWMDGVEDECVLESTSEVTENLENSIMGGYGYIDLT